LIENRPLAAHIAPENTGDDAHPAPTPDGKVMAWTAAARDGYGADQ